MNGNSVETWLNITSGPQLFLDDYFINDLTGLKRTICPPVRHPEPVLKEREKYTGLHHVVVLFDQGRFRMWYFVKSPLGKSHAYAESLDGIQWTLPDLGLVEVEGSRDNNLLPIDSLGATGYPFTLLDNGPEFPEKEQRFMGLGCCHVDGKNIGAWALFSPDGIHWTAPPENPVVPFDGWSWGETGDTRKLIYDNMDVFYDPAKGRYIYIMGMLAQPEDGYVGVSKTGPIRRLIGQCESRDFVHWSPPRRIMAPECRDDMTEFYNMTMVYRNGLYLGFVRILRDDLPADPGGPIEGVGWTELAVSRNGENWTRLPGVYFDRHSSRGAFDHAMAWLRAPVYVNREMYFYYWGFDEGHKVGRHEIGLARSPHDRFAGLENTGGNPGRIITKSFFTPCDEMTLNADASRGHLRVQLADVQGRPLPGYSFDDTLPVAGDSLTHSVRWKNHIEFPENKKSGMRIEIEIKQAMVFAINFGKGNEK